MTDRRITNRLKNYDDLYLMCRYRRHTWQHEGFFRATDNNGSKLVASQLICTTCNTRRRDWLAAKDGTVVARDYRHPAGFLFKYDGIERAQNIRVRQHDVALNMIGRADVYADEESFNERRT